MEIEIVQDTRNELLSRRELRFVLTHDGPTPSRKEIVGKLSALQNVPPERTVLGPLSTRYGTMQAEGELRVYDTDEAKARAESEYLFRRGEPKPAEEA